MAFPNNNSNKKNVSVNTRGRRLANSESQVASVMELGYWDSFATVRIHPALPKEMQTDTKKWDLENYLQTTISPDKAVVLVRGIDEQIIPAIKEGTDAETNVIVGGDSVFQIRTRNIDGKQITLATIAKTLDPNSKKPANSISYHFKDTQVLNKYDHNTGEFEVGSNSIAELELFKYHLLAHLNSGTNSYVHAHRVVDRMFREKLLGVQTDNSGSSSYNTNNVFGAGSGSNNSSSESYSTNTLESSEELSKLMGMS